MSDIRKAARGGRHAAARLCAATIVALLGVVACGGGGSAPTAGSSDTGGGTSGGTSGGSSGGNTGGNTGGNSGGSSGGNSGGNSGGSTGGQNGAPSGCSVAGQTFCEDFEASALGDATSTRWSIDRRNASATIDAVHTRGNRALHLHATDNGMAFLVPSSFAPAGNSGWGRMWVWMQQFPTAPAWAHFTMVEASGSDSGTLVRPIGGQFVPGEGNGHALWGTGSDGGPTGDWTNWQRSTPTADGRWTCLEWQLDASDNAMRVWIDGSERPELATSTRSHGGQAVDFVFPHFDRIRIGWQLYQGGTTPAAFDVWLDDLVLAESRVGCGEPSAPPPAATTWKGVSLAGAEFGEGALPGSFGSDYTYPSASEAAYFQGKRMNLVRLPFRWERLQPTLYGALDGAELARLKGFVDSVTGAGMDVLLDPHNYARWKGSLIGSTAVPNAAFADFWSRLAGAFKDNPKVVLGLMNEPHDIPSEQWLAAANAAIQAIRQAGSTQLITVPGNAWTGAWSWQDNWYGTPNATVMLGVVDPAQRYLIEVHQYLDDDKSGTRSECSGPTVGSARLAAFTQWARAHGVRAVLGEIGAPSTPTCDAAVTDALNHLKTNADVWAGWLWWAAGPWWGSYSMSIEPAGGVDKPQMKVLTPFLD